MSISRFAPYAVNILRVHFRAGLPWVATELLKDGQKIGNVRLEAEDGRTVVLYEFDSVRNEYEFRRHLSELPQSFFEELPADTTSAIGLYFIELIDAWHLQKSLEKLCSKHVVFRLKGDMQDCWRTSNKPWSPDVAKELRAEFGSAIDVVANEMLELEAEKVADLAGQRPVRTRRARVAANTPKTAGFPASLAAAVA